MPDPHTKVYMCQDCNECNSQVFYVIQFIKYYSLRLCIPSTDWINQSDVISTIQAESMDLKITLFISYLSHTYRLLFVNLFMSFSHLSTSSSASFTFARCMVFITLLCLFMWPQINRFYFRAIPFCVSIRVMCVLSAFLCLWYVSYLCFDACDIYFIFASTLVICVLSVFLHLWYVFYIVFLYLWYVSYLCFSCVFW